jgi:hypothetical protein
MDVQTITVVIAGIGVIIGVVNSLLSSRKADQQRQAELFMQLYNRYITPEFRAALTELRSWSWTDFDDFMAKYGPDTNPAAYNLHISTQDVYEGIGIMVERGLIDISLVVDFVWFALGYYWQRFGPIWEEWRVRLGHMNLADQTEALYHHIQQIKQPSAVFAYTAKERETMEH